MSEQDRRWSSLLGALGASAQASSPSTDGEVGRSLLSRARLSLPGILLCSPSRETSPIPPPSTGSSVGHSEFWAHRHPHQRRWRLHLQAVYRLHDRRLRRAVGVNLTGFFLLTQRVIGEMLTRGGGHVLNITTTLADYANSGTPSVLTSLTKGGSPRPPGHWPSSTRPAASASTRSRRGSSRRRSIPQSPTRELAGLHPLGRVGQVSDIVGGILFLESSPFITGEILHIDGGQIAGH